MTILEPTLKPAAVPGISADADTGGVLIIDLAAIEANWKRLAGMTVPVDCAAVVKADAYGCGLPQVAAKLYKARCRTFFVADLSEGRTVRSIAREAVIYVLNGGLPGTGPALGDS